MSDAFDDPRPLIQVRAGELEQVVRKAQKALADGHGRVFRYGGGLAHVERLANSTKRHGQHVPAGVLEVVACDDIWLRHELAIVAQWERWKEFGEQPQWVPCDPPRGVAQTVLVDMKGWCVPVLTGTTEVPIVREDGSVHDSRGYDPETGLFYEPGGVRFPPVPDEPTQKQAAAALYRLSVPLEEFPFVEPHHKSAALAMILTAVIRRQLPAAPMYAISARDAGTGKGLLADVASIIATGRRAPVASFSQHEEEARKHITSALAAGHHTILLDNLEVGLDSPALCALLTAETWSDRLLGGNRMITVPANAMVIATGNNLKISGDLTRRTIQICIDAGMERPETRTFKRDDLEGWLKQNRAQLVCDCLTVIAAFRRAGQPVEPDFRSIGSYATWSTEIVGALLWLAQEDPTKAMDALRAADPKRQLLARALESMAALFGSTWQTVGSIMQGATVSSKDAAIPLREAIEEITARAKDEKGARIALGRWLEREAGRAASGFRLDRELDAHTKQKLWRATPCR